HFAGRLIGEFQREVKLLPHTHRFAGFAVLKSPDVPSVLIEMGYLSNRQDETSLRSDGYRAKLMAAVARGLDQYFAPTQIGRDLPDYRALASYAPPLMTRVYASDGKLLQEYAVEGRVFVPLDAIPQRVVDAFISAEDQNFYAHHGIDPIGILRAVFTAAEERLQGSDRRMKGASTITQQVAQNFLLGKEYKFTRKVREAILSVRMEQAFTKEHILELY